MNLPPDPEEMNDDRAEWAAQAVDTFARATGMFDNEDNQTILADLLCDIRHWCDRNDASFAGALQTAEMHYEAETQDDD